MLLRQTQSGPGVTLANHFNYSQLKKRFIMMKKSKSRPIAYAKFLLMLPIALLIFFLFAATTIKDYSTVSQLNGFDINILEEHPLFFKDVKN